ncbi:MAG: hypothetical protein OEW23_17890 [Candidatus Aminicenantes bacterium]|nr:hypothetical protein [Candidatus Aminicenantes bacterium]MDH5465917.1 hypothetical protein [Candidatus Aminicenantes bacterium]MDH5705314.1 hypothetical protein [Candidatus Aminicenantes bacterium]
MKKLTIIGAIVILGLSVFSQQVSDQKLSEETMVINVEVPVRVFQGNRFIDDLTLNDFEVLEDGIPQRVEAVYLVKKRSIERREENKRFAPETSRNFYLFFEINEYTAKLGDAVEYFVHEILVPGDNLTVITSMKTYRLKGKTLEVLSKEDIVNQLKGILRRDAMIGNSEYRDILDDMVRLAKSLASAIQSFGAVTDEATEGTEAGSVAFTTRYVDGFSTGQYEGMSIDEQITRYADLLGRLENIRSFEQKKFLEFSDLIKDKEGQKYIFMFYEKEYIPQIDPKILDQYLAIFQDRPNIIHTISGLFDFYRREITLDVERIKQAYADSSISIHFLFISRPPQHVFGIRMEEHSEDIFSVFHEMAKATGGYSASSANSAFLFQQALGASENYYLLYYTPQNYKSDGKFKEIKVKVKDKNFRVEHRLGYFAR